MITLAIIGVVAALTIPVVVANYQKKAYYTAFMKTYNSIVTALDLSSVDNGDIKDWGWGYNNVNEVEVFNEKIAPYLKISKMCSSDVSFTDCLAPEFSLLNIEPNPEEPWESDNFGGAVAMLSDGSVVGISGGGSYGSEFTIYFWIDTNGKKGPNILGRDVFYLKYVNDSFDVSETYEDGTRPDEYGGTYPSNCATDTNEVDKENGTGCAARLLIEGKMNY